MKIGVILNPNAKKNMKLEKRKTAFEKIIGGAGFVIQTDNIELIGKSCGKLVEEKVDLIGICGGDGTNHLVVTDVVKEYKKANSPPPLIYLMEGGSMNTIRWNLGIKGSSEDNLKNIVGKLENNLNFQIKKVATLKVNEQYGFIFGNGYASAFLFEYYNSKIDSGPKRAAEITGRIIWSLITGGDLIKRIMSQYKAGFVIDGQPAGLDSYGLVLAGTLPAIGLMFKPLYRATEELDKFHLIASSLKPGDFARQIHRFFSGKRIKGENHIDTLASELKITTDEPLVYQLDGELYSEKSVNVSIGPVLNMILQ